MVGDRGWVGVSVEKQYTKPPPMGTNRVSRERDAGTETGFPHMLGAHPPSCSDYCKGQFSAEESITVTKMGK